MLQESYGVNRIYRFSIVIAQNQRLMFSAGKVAKTLRNGIEIKKKYHKEEREKQEKKWKKKDLKMDLKRNKENQNGKN